MDMIPTTSLLACRACLCWADGERMRAEERLDETYLAIDNQNEPRLCRAEHGMRTRCWMQMLRA
jgi:hypothetical protein